MSEHPRKHWDRAAELESIRDAYRQFESSGRAQGWASPNRGYRRLARDLRDAVVAEIHRSLPAGRATVLDVGCGTGDLMPDVLRGASGAVDWIGIDLRADAIELARADYPNGRFEVASADAMPAATASVNVAVANVMFSSLRSHDLVAAVVRELQRVLVPGGWLVWLDLRYANPSNRVIRAIDRRRLATIFPGWTIDVRAKGLVPPIARRLGPTTPVTYPALSATGPLRSHLVGRLQPPTIDG